jgi:uncharacterized membrane protein YsdA (DUF1294 family)
MGLAMLFIMLIAAADFAGSLPSGTITLYIGISTIAIAVYASDKSAAAGGRRRTPETALHLIAVLGGWPGALAAQRFLRHKTRKIAFQAVFWFMALINCAALAWLWTYWGATLLPSNSPIAPENPLMSSRQTTISGNPQK